MSNINRITARGWSRLGQRGTFFGVAMPELAAKDTEVIVLTADLSSLSGLERFKKEFPDRMLNVGIAEQNMIDIAAGLSKEGFKSYATTYSCFIAMRSYEQVRIDCGYMQFPLRIVGSGSGLSMGLSGNTHYGIEDISLMRSIPNMTVVCPADAVEAYKIAYASLDYPHPMYIRLTGVLNAPIVYAEDYEYKIGKANYLVQGSDIAIIANGPMVATCLEVAKRLKKNKISTSVVNMHTIKPLDREIVIKLASNSRKLIVTVEEHSVIGGLGSAVAEVFCDECLGIKTLRIGIEDTFLHPGDYDYLLGQCGLTVDGIYNRILKKLEN